MISLESVQAEPGVVRLAWYTAGAADLRATLYRHSEDSDWSPLSEISPDGAGHLTYEDHGVEAGRRYGYRLGIHSGDAEEYGREVWVDVPTGYTLALQGVRPNPAVRELLASFSLPDERPATLEVFDLAGRRLWSRRVDSLGPGSHLLNLGKNAVRGAGVYLLRLTHGSGSLTRRAVVAR